MTDNGTIIASIIGAMVGLVLIFSIVIVIYICSCCIVYVDQASEGYRISDLNFSINSERQRKVIKNIKLTIDPTLRVKKSQDLENQNHDISIIKSSETASSNVALKSVLIPDRERRNTVTDGDIVVDISKDDTTNTSEYRSAIDTFDYLTEGLFETIGAKKINKNYNKRMSSIHYKKNNSNSFKTVIARPSHSEQLYISDQYDSFSRTLMLQNLIENSVNNNELVIREVRDPFSESLISVGGIVVVVKPFHGTEEYEFNALQSGDLLRIVKFYIKENSDESIKSINCIANDPISPAIHSTDISDLAENDNDSNDKTLDGYRTSVKHDMFVDRTDPNYENIYCTGIILNTYLEYNNETSDLSLRFKKSVSAITDEKELLKDFPLKNISLETTVLRTMVDSPETIDTFEKHFS